MTQPDVPPAASNKSWLSVLHPWRSKADQETEDPLQELVIPPPPELSESGAPAFTDLVDYADEALGAHIIFASDEYKCSAANILCENPQLIWTTRRRRVTGHDWCIIKLPIPIIIRGVEIQTTDDAPPHISVEAALEVKSVATKLYSRLESEFPDYVPRAADKGCLSGGSFGHPVELQNMASQIVDSSATWRNVIEVAPVKRNRVNYFEVTTDESCASQLKVDMVRLNLLPDGGIARFRLFGEVALDIGPVHRIKERESKTKLIDYAAALNGGQVVYASAGRASANALLLPSDALHRKFWFTPRQPLRPMFIQQIPGTSELKFAASEQVIVALAARCSVVGIDISTAQIHGDLPYKVHLSLCDLSEIRKLPSLRQHAFFARSSETVDWFDFGCLDDVTGDETYSVTMNKPGPATHLKIEIVPDGALTRVALYGHFCEFENGR